MKSVIDTSTLISLARIAYLEIIPMVRKNVSIPDAIYEESVVKGEEKGFADATVIKKFIEKHRIEIVRVQPHFMTVLRRKLGKILSVGDESVLSLAMQQKAEEIVTDDDGLGRLAMVSGLDVTASPDLLWEGLRKNRLSLEAFEIFIRGLVIENRLGSAVAELYILEGRKDAKR